MILWGVIWGAVLGVAWPGSGEFGLVAGLLLGAAAGYSLRRAVRSELARGAAQAAPRGAAAIPAAVPIPAPAPMPAASPIPATAPIAPAAPVPSVPGPLPAQPSPRPAAAPTQPDLVSTLIGRARAWLFGGNTVVRMGVVVLFIGLAFLARYAVENALLPPELRLAGIAAAGIALFVIGLRQRSRPERADYALTLQGAGIAVLYLTVFAAFRLYQFLPPAAAFGALGLICLFSGAIAIAQNAQALAFIGFAGAFAAPLLVSGSQGGHVGLFGYYLLLGVAIAAVAWTKAWRALNLLGFFATFGIATAWGVLRYRPEQLSSTEPFLVGFFLVYLLASLFYALRHGQAAQKAVDATLVFGTPIAAFGLQAALVHDIPYASAFSAVAMGALYVGLAAWLLRRRSGDLEVGRWLAECFLAMAFGFITLAVPLALDGRWTSAAWAVEGAAVYWMGRRQERWLARACGIALQLLAALLFLAGQFAAQPGALPFANPVFIGAAMLAGAALAIAWWSREPLARHTTSAAAKAFGSFETGFSPLLLWIGFLWAQAALGGEIARLGTDGADGYDALQSSALQRLLHMAAWVFGAFALHQLALPQRRRPWPAAAMPAWLVLPVMLYAALAGMGSHSHLLQSGGWMVWPPVLALHLFMLRRLDAGEPRGWWPWVHAGGVWLLVLLVGNLLVFAIGRADLWRTAWATVVLLAAASMVLLALVLACRRVFAESRAAAWPLDRFGGAYAWRAAAPVALLLAAGALLVAVVSDGDARPLPYLPLLNPTDLCVALALGACTLWLVRLRASPLAVPAWVRGPQPVAVLAGIAFIATNTVWLRIAHHFANVPWDAGSLFSSFLVQAGYSILWTLIALALMVGAHRRGLRAAWMLGAGLLGLTVLKLFVIDLSNRGGSERIVVFIAVGLLMLVVGWFAPLPPVAAPRPPRPDSQLQGVA